MTNIHMISKRGKDNFYERNTLPKGSQWRYGFPIKLLTFQERSKKKETLMCEVKKAIQTIVDTFKSKKIGDKAITYLRSQDNKANVLRKIESNATSGGIEDPAQYLQQWYNRISKSEPSVDYDNPLSSYMSNYHIKQFLQKYEFTFLKNINQRIIFLEKEKMFAQIGINAS